MLDSSDLAVLFSSLILVLSGLQRQGLYLTLESGLTCYWNQHRSCPCLALAWYCRSFMNEKASGRWWGNHQSCLLA